MNKDSIFIDDEKKIYYVNAKYAYVPHRGCREISGLNAVEVQKEKQKLNDLGYKCLYAKDFESYREE